MKWQVVLVPEGDLAGTGCTGVVEGHDALTVLAVGSKEPQFGAGIAWRVRQYRGPTSGWWRRRVQQAIAASNADHNGGKERHMPTHVRARGVNLRARPWGNERLHGQ
jgi:hypothetical protein